MWHICPFWFFYENKSKKCFKSWLWSPLIPWMLVGLSCLGQKHSYLRELLLPIQTVSLISGKSQPIPAHFVLMSSLQSLWTKKYKTLDSISISVFDDILFEFDKYESEANPSHKLMMRPARLSIKHCWLVLLNKVRFSCVILPSHQGSHHSVLLLPRVVTTQLLYVGGTEVVDAKRLCLLLSPGSWMY